MEKTLITIVLEYFFKGDMSKKEKAAKLVTAAIAVLTVATALLSQVSDYLK